MLLVGEQTFPWFKVAQNPLALLHKRINTQARPLNFAIIIILKSLLSSCQPVFCNNGIGLFCNNGIGLKVQASSGLLCDNAACALIAAAPKCQNQLDHFFWHVHVKTNKKWLKGQTDCH